MLSLTATFQADADLALATALAADLLPQFQAALTATAADNEAAHALELMKRSVTAPVVMPSPLSLLSPLPSQSDVPSYTTRRIITCATYLRRLHVTREMVSRGTR